MSIHKGDFSPRHRAAIEAVAENLGVSFAAALKSMVEAYLSGNTSLPSPYQNVNTSLTGEPLRRGASNSSSSSVASSESSGSGEGGGVSSGWEGEKDLPQGCGDSKREEKQEEAPAKGKRSKRGREPEPPVPIPPLDIDSPDLRAALAEFAEYRRRRGEPMTEKAWKLLLNRLRIEAGAESAVALQYAMHENWKSWQPKFTEGLSWDSMRAYLGMPPRRPEAVARAPSSVPQARLVAWPVSNGYEDRVYFDGTTYTREEWTEMGREWPRKESER